MYVIGRKDTQNNEDSITFDAVIRPNVTKMYMQA